MQESGIKYGNGCPVCNKIRQKSVSEWKYEIGQRIKDDGRDLIIIDKEVRIRPQSSSTCVSGTTVHYEKYYKYHCNICGYNDGWKVESSINAGQGCACCNSTVVVEGINDIPTTAPWMVKFFQNGYNEAKNFTKSSNNELYFRCPDCGKIKSKKMKISTVYYMKGIGCECSDGISYPEKFFANFLNQLHIPFEKEFRFIGNKYRYDFIAYSIKKDRLFIVETDGALGHGNYSWGKKDIKKSRELFLRDMEKTITALSYGIPVIRLDCLMSDKDYISNSIINNKELKEYLDIKNIDWNRCDEFALKNLVKIICLDYRKNKDIKYLAEKYKLCTSTIKNYLKKGSIHGWTS